MSALAACALLPRTAADGAGPSSANDAIPSSTINAGVGDMAAVNYKLSSWLGAPFFGGTMASAS